MPKKKTTHKGSGDDPEFRTRELSRTPISVPVRVDGPKRGKKKTRTADLTEAGTFVLGAEAEVGAEVALSLDLPDGEQIEVEGEVRWVRPHTINPNLPAGIGVEFKQPQPKIAQALEAAREEQDE